MAITFPIDIIMFAFFGARSPPEVHWFDSSFSWWILVDICVVHSNESTQKLLWITLKYGEIRFRNGRVHERHNIRADSFLMSSLLCKRLSDRWPEMHTASAIPRTFILRASIHHSLQFINHFGCCNLIWASTTFGVTCVCMTTSKLSKPVLDGSNRWSP